MSDRGVSRRRRRLPLCGSDTRRAEREARHQGDVNDEMGTRLHSTPPSKPTRSETAGLPRMRLSPRWLALLPMLCSPALGAQTSLSAGLTAGSAKLTDRRSEQALSGVLMLQATPWLSLSALPSIVHVSDTVSGRAVTSNGLGDLSLSAPQLHSFPAP